MKESFINALIKFKDVMVSCLSGAKELFTYIITLLISLMIPYKDEISFIFILVVVDWMLAMAINAKKGNLQSAKVKNVIGKICFYSLGFLIAGGLDRFIDVEILGAIVTAALLISEVLSVFANMIIIWPNIPVIPKLKKYLEKELDRKLKADDNGEEYL